MKECRLCKKEKEEKEFTKAIRACKECYKKWYLEKRGRTCPKCRERYVGRNDFCSNKCKLLSMTIKKKNGCWEWKGYQAVHGYCPTKDYDNKGENIPVHRLSYRIFKGEIPFGLCVCHSCDNRKCCNPDHLWVGTKKENSIDASKKGRLTFPKNYGEKNGHAKLNSEKVKVIRQMIKEGKMHKEIAPIFGISTSVISEIRNKKLWAHVED